LAFMANILVMWNFMRMLIDQLIEFFMLEKSTNLKMPPKAKSKSQNASVVPLKSPQNHEISPEITFTSTLTSTLVHSSSHVPPIITSSNSATRLRNLKKKNFPLCRFFFIVSLSFAMKFRSRTKTIYHALHCTIMNS
jgi:hypothetical protein